MPIRRSDGGPPVTTALGWSRGVALFAMVFALVGFAPSAEAAPRTLANSRAQLATLPPSPLRWTPCGDLQCASLAVPLSYADPSGVTIEIALARHLAEIPSERIGSLVINPGGPGASGIDDLPTELSVLTPGLLDRFDIVSFDPRGVERSSPVTCGTAGEAANSAPVDPVPTTAAGRLALLQNDKDFASDCERASGAILPYVGTVDVARDLDRIRAALGDAKLTFIGHSYGTLLGATYAELFPTHVRAMVLDGAIDPALGTDQYVAAQAQSFEVQLESFFAWCAADVDCPWHPAGNPTSALLSLIQRSQAEASALYNALLSGLGAQSYWPSLASALAEAGSGDGSAASSIANRYESGGSTNGADAVEAVDCLDHPVNRDSSHYPALAAELGRSAAVFGPLLAWGLLGCATWPASPTRTPAPASDPGSPPILVVGTTGDPVTPYRWAVALAKELSGGRLLTWRGQSHVAYFYSPCVRAAAQAYLVAGVLPEPGAVCTD